MAWTTPLTWVTNQLVTAAQLNQQLRDNLNYLLTPTQFLLTSTSAFTTTSTSYVNVNAALVSASLTVYGGHILLGCSGWLASTGSALIDVAIGHDGANEVLVHRSNTILFFAATLLKVGIAAGSHTFSMRWKVNTGTATMRGADDTGVAIGPIIFWGIEI